MFELGGITRKIAEEALQLASHKLPIKTKFVVRQGFEENNHGMMKSKRTSPTAGTGT